MGKFRNSTPIAPSLRTTHRQAYIFCWFASRARSDSSGYLLGWPDHRQPLTHRRDGRIVLAFPRSNAAGIGSLRQLATLRRFRAGRGFSSRPCESACGHLPLHQRQNVWRPEILAAPLQPRIRRLAPQFPAMDAKTDHSGRTCLRDRWRSVTRFGELLQVVIRVARPTLATIPLELDLLVASQAEWSQRRIAFAPQCVAIIGPVVDAMGFPTAHPTVRRG